jgi:2-polyprenyl-6-methoxyphenol hydroxylase-like FAD-dependent oxidoreductase
VRVGVIGGGFGGLAAAIAFRRKGHDVTVFERTAGPASAGGAISLAPNALRCLHLLGVDGQLSTQPWSDMPATIRSSSGRVLVRSTMGRLTGGAEFACAPRAQLISWLTAALPREAIRYRCPVSTVTADGVIEASGVRQQFDLVVAADGAHGLTRSLLWPQAQRLRRTGISGWAWIVDAALSEGFGTIWGADTDFGILPLHDGRTYVYGGTSRRGAELDSFRNWPHPLTDLIAQASTATVTTPEIFEARPPRHLINGKVVLIGDAAHTMRPTFGQGAALAMEDALTLAYRGTAGLARRWPRMLAMYGGAKAGSYVATPRIAALETIRNWALRLTPDPAFGVMSGSVSHWRMPSRAEVTRRSDAIGG